MTRHLFSLTFIALLGLVASPAAAQQAEPIVEIDLADTDVIPGQPSILRITVLVPTWLAKPVEFPNFETPDLMVKLLEGSTNATSRTINGDTWSGVSRAYRLSPMAPGEITIPGREMRIIWAAPGKTDPNEIIAAVDAIQITGIVPDGAEGLDPFIAANALTLTQEIDNEATVLKPGDSVTRTVSVKVDGTSPLFVPTLLPRHNIEGIASYPAEPEVRETSDRNWVSGTRTESVTLVAESGGSGTLPPIDLRWYNLKTGTVETAKVEGRDISVDAPVARNRQELDVRAIAFIAILITGAILTGYLAQRYLVPPIRQAIEERRAARLASEDWAFDQLRRVIRNRDYPALSASMTQWVKRMPGTDPRDEPALIDSLARLSECLYGPVPSDPAEAWTELSRTVSETRARLLKTEHQKSRSALAPMNPT